MTFFIAEIRFNFFNAQRLEAKIGRCSNVMLVRLCVRGIRSQSHGNVDVFENLPWSNAEDSVEGLDQVVALPSAVLPAKMVDEAEARAELFGLN